MTIDQRYRDNYTLLLITGFLILSLAKAGQIILQEGQINLELLLSFALGGGLLILLFQFFKARLLVKIKKKKIVIKLTSLPFFKISLRRDQIESIDFLQTSPLLSYTGELLHFGSINRVINFGGNKTMEIRLKNGKTYYFVSEKLFQQKDEILNTLNP